MKTEMGWMPDCRACAWHDGTLAVEWRREARKMIAEDYARRTTQLAWLATMLYQVQRKPSDRPMTAAQAMAESFNEGIIKHGPGECVPAPAADTKEVAPGIVLAPHQQSWWDRVRGR